MKVALSIGHHPSAQGCQTYDRKFTEYSLWKEYLPLIKFRLEKLGHIAVIVNRADGGGKTPSYAAIACNATNADLAIEFHFNSFSSASATGTETFYWHSSVNGKRAARLVNDAMVSVLGLADRGIKPIIKADQNAYSYFQKTKMPAILVEPSFATSNPGDCECLLSKMHSFCDAIAQAINRYAQS